MGASSNLDPSDTPLALTDIAIRNTKAAEKPFKLADSGGLFLFVTPAGGKLWRLKFRINGREKLLSIGAYPTISLKDAREARETAKRLLAKGLDPSESKREAKLAEEAETKDTFDAVAHEYIDKLKREGRATATIVKAEWFLSFAIPTLGRRSIRGIRPHEVLSVLRVTEARGRHETARKMRSTIGAVFRYAIASGRADNDPTTALQGALTRPVVTPMAAITDTVRFGAMLRAVWGYEGTPETASALKLMALLFPRPGELRFSEWTEFDLLAGVWTVPAARAKMRRVHRCPLPGQAAKVLNDLRGITGGGQYVFPSVRSQARCMSENTLNAALRRLGYATHEATAHGFRASFSTLANESGRWHPDAIERALAHVDSSDVRRAYARGEHWDERVRMAAWWADHCDAMRAGHPTISTHRSE